jgi:isoquinoline 1-oxidoreductase beta subunit
MSGPPLVPRREFLKATTLAGAGLVIGVRLGSAQRLGKLESAALQPNVWLHVSPGGHVTIWCARSEMGQGVLTSMPMLIAEELEVGLDRVRVEQAIADPKYGEMSTGGSWSVRGSWTQLRKAGAAAREMLVAAAAKRWDVATSACRAADGGVVYLPTGRKIPYHELVAAAAALPVPRDPPLKDPKDFRLLGKPVARLDLADKVSGMAEFGLDVQVPDMRIAVVARCPVFGGQVGGFDAARAKAVPGVRNVVRCGAGVAVVADTLWAARAGRDALDLRWNEGPGAALDSPAIRAKFVEFASRRGASARMEGDGAAAIARAARKLDAIYEVPFQAHSPMEPMNCTARVTRDLCEIWVPTQVQTDGVAAAARITGLPQSKIRLKTTLLGGGFGRRLETDYIEDAVEIARATGTTVKVVWSREEELQHDFYRPATYNLLAAGLDAKRALLGWSHRIVGPSISARTSPAWVAGSLDRSAVDGAANLPYAIPNIEVDYVQCEVGVPVGYWRSVGNSQNAFVVEAFVDEVAAAAGRDPLEFRRELLRNQPRHRAVLELAAEKAGWGTPLANGHGRGIAVHRAFGSWVAMVAEVSLGEDGAPRVHRVVCAVDCGMTVNPDTIEAQMEGGVAFGLTAALKGPITFAKGRVVQSNFDDYEMLRMNEMPGVEVHIVPSTEPPGGVGEPGVPPVAPAVANALFAATGKRLRSLPITAAAVKAG